VLNFTWRPAPATRYLIGVVADGEHVWAVLDAAFREFGLPKRYAPRLADASSACLVQPLKSVRSRCLGLPRQAAAGSATAVGRS
jgi:hypothetical protein